MTANRDHGDSEFAPIFNLPAQQFEMPLDPAAKYGEAEPNKVYNLPGATVDLTDASFVPALLVIVTPRADSTGAELGLDLYRLYGALNQYEISLGGQGLSLDEPQCKTVPNGVIRVTFRPNQKDGSVERINKLLKAINKPTDEVPALPARIDRCVASFVRAS